MGTEKILKEVNNYYTNKIKQFGTTPQGVDWNGEESQLIRFQQLTKVIEEDDFSLIDYGCGYGSLYQFLTQKNRNFKYIGLDVSEEMIAAAQALNYPDTYFTTKKENLKKSDYVIASGIFNVMLNYTKEDWHQYILDVLNTMNKLCVKGFSFNMLTSYSDKPFMKDYLYYAQPEFFFTYCKQNFSKQVALLHDYPLYEFSIIIKK